MVKVSNGRTTGLFALIVLVATALIVSTVAAGAGPLAAVGLQDDGGDEDDAFPPNSDDYDDPVVEYEAVDLQIALESANESDVDYELLVLGAVEPANESADNTVSCEEQSCTIEGTVGEGDRPTYNVSGVVVEVTPDEGLEAHVNGTLEGDALVGLGWGAAEGEDPLSEREPGSADDDDASEAGGDTSQGDDSGSDADDSGSDDSDDSGSDDSDDATAASTSGDRDCSDFDTQDEAQAVYEREPGVHDLDRDDDDAACESLP